MTAKDDIEDALYACLVPGAPQIKVAMLIGRAFGPNLPVETTVDEALQSLARRPDIETFGMISNWRRSEIKRHKES